MAAWWADRYLKAYIGHGLMGNNRQGIRRSERYEYQEKV